MADLFISHSSEDRELAEKIRDALIAKGFTSLFLDVDINNGIAPFEEWEKVLYHKLRACRAVIAVCTDNFLSSKWCFAELAVAHSLERSVLPVIGTPFTGNVKTLPARLAFRQFFDLRKKGVKLETELYRGLSAIGIDPSPWGPWDPERSPYPGLFSFNEDYAPVFFGRDKDLVPVLSALHGARFHGYDRFITIIGSSGSGKSSLMRAGILPKLRLSKTEHWMIVPVRPFQPGHTPLTELAVALAKTFDAKWRKILEKLKKKGGLSSLLQNLVRDCPQNDPRLLLALDQFEECLGNNKDQIAFLNILNQALDEVPDLIVLATLRSDYLPSLQEHEVFRGTEKRLLPIDPIGQDELAQAIRQPARIAGAEIEDDLVEQILKDAELAPGRLPLIAFTLSRLWEKSISGSDRLLTLKEYNNIGGIAGAISTRAEECLSSNTSDEELASLRLKFQELVDLDEKGRYRSQRAVWHENEPAEHLLDRLQQGRLLTVNLVEGERVIEVAHESLFEEWKLLKQWLTEDKEILGFRAELARAAIIWNRDGETTSDLWRGGRLQRAEELRESGQLALNPLEQRFLEAGIQLRLRELLEEDARREQLIKQAAVTLARGLAIQARDAISKYPQRALALSVEAISATRDNGLPINPMAETVLHSVLSQVNGVPLYSSSKSAFYTLSVSHDKRWLASGQEDGTVSLWKLSNGIPTGETIIIGNHKDIVTTCIWHKDELFTTSKDGSIACWYPDNPKQKTKWVRNQAEIYHAAVDPFGRWFVAGAGHDIIVWPLEIERSFFILKGHNNNIRALSFHPQGAFLLSSDLKGELLLWLTDINDIGSQKIQVQAPEGNRIEDIAFDPNNRFFVTACLDGVIQWWMTRNEEGHMQIKAEILNGMQEYAIRVVISPDGKVIAAGSYYEHCFAWIDSDSFKVPIALGSGIRLPADPFGSKGFGLLTVSQQNPTVFYRSLTQLNQQLKPMEFLGDDKIQPVLFLPNGAIATGDTNGILRYWEAGSRQPESFWIPEPGLDLNNFETSDEDFIVLTAGERLVRGRELDRRAKFVNMETYLYQPLSPFDEGIDAVAISANGRFMALGSDRKNTIIIIDNLNKVQGKIDVESGVSCLAFDWEGRWLAAGLNSNKIKVLDPFLGSEVKTLDTESSILKLVFDKDAKRLAASIAGGITKVWNIQAKSDTPIEYQKKGGLVNFLKFTDNNNAIILSGSWGISDKGFVVYGQLNIDPKNWTELKLGSASEFYTKTAIDMSLDGTKLVAAGNGSNIARVFNLSDLSIEPTDLQSHDKRIRDVAISQDGKRIATSSEDSTIHLWDLEHSEPVVLSVVNGSAGYIAFRNNYLFAISESALHRWDLNIEHLISMANKTASRNLTAKEWNRFLTGKPRATFPNLAFNID